MHPTIRLPACPSLSRLAAALLCLPVLTANLAAQAPAAATPPGAAAPAAQPAGRGGGGGGRGAAGPLSTVTEQQMFRFAKELNTDFLIPALAVTNARSALAAASLAAPRNDAAISARAADLARLELELAVIKANAFARIQASPDRLTRAQADAIAANGGRYSAPGGLDSGRDPLDFNDRIGYVPIFDGVSLKGWDGNPKFWRVENGMMIGESSAASPSGNQYISYREMEAHDFTAKFEVKVEGVAGTGFQYRSKTGIPWLANVPDAVTTNVGPVQLQWMQTGPQADFWPSRMNTWTGQFYSENTPMRIMAPRGTVVEGFGGGRKVVLGTLGDASALQAAIKLDDWNQYTVIARGGVFIHIINGQVMSVMIDDDPKSSNNWTGQFGFELESTGRVLVRNVWVKKIN